ncbi:MAG: pyridoxal-phosphate dependent enzyme [Candidatus ainarchaeum sp.]|nr:pyridoxal-phosphate dependent enzyme [Candidatus ainarchaeum sp.]
MNTSHELISLTALAVANSRAFSDIPYAQEILAAAKKIEKTKEQPDSAKFFGFKEVAPSYEARYKLVNKLLLESRQEQVLEIAAGLSPRGIYLASQIPIKYVEMDLPGLISTKRRILEKVRKDLPPNFHLESGNALDLKDLEAAARNFDKNKEIAIVNEGLLRYLNFDEKSVVAKNVHSLLSTFGGVWITPDITLKKGLAKENKSISIIKNTKKAIGIDINQNAFENQDEAKEFFERLGFNVEVHSFLEVENELVSPAKLKISKEKVREMIGQWVVFVMKPKKSVEITYFPHGTTFDNEKKLLTGLSQGKLSALDAIGNTSLVRLEKNIFAKLEFLNPSGSMKDRVAKEIILQAEKKGLLNRKKTVLEVSGGNMGISLAMICREKDYKCEIILPNHAGERAAALVRKHGGKVIMANDFFEAEKLAEEMLKKHPEKYFYADQSKNSATITANKKFGKEILKQFGKKIDFFVAASGTGGTICGVSMELKKFFPEMQAIAVLPEEKTGIAGVYSFEKSHKTRILEKCGGLIDKKVVVSDRTAFAEAKKIRKKFGFCVGPTSGMNYNAAKKLGGNIIIVFADSSERYEALC